MKRAGSDYGAGPFSFERAAFIRRTVVVPDERRVILRLLPTLAAALLAIVPAQAATRDAPQTADRAARRSQSQIDRLQRAYDRHMKRCSSNDENACSDARDELAQIQTLKAAAP